jgi:glycyl-tRNA synthetase alpha subunit
MSREEFSAFHRDLFDRYYMMGERLLKSNLVLPALEYALKCSHVFNILDASGSVGVTERTAYVLRVRQLAIAIAQAYTQEPLQDVHGGLTSVPVRGADSN